MPFFQKPNYSMKLDTNHKIFEPNNEAAEEIGKVPTLFTKYVLREIPAADADLEEPNDPILEELNEVLNFEREQKTELFAMNAPLKLQNEQFPRILFLGTGAADSYLLRNSTGILVHISYVCSLL